MFEEPLPKEAEVRKLAVKQAHFKLDFPAKCLARFASVTESDEAQISVDLSFDLDEQRRYQLTGSVSCSTLVICQRCMDTMPLELDCDVNIVVVYDDTDAKQLPKTVEPLVVPDGDLVDLNEVVEDELLLNMPFTSFHEDENCYSKRHEFLDPNAGDLEEAEESDSDKDNPFSVLTQLKTSDTPKKAD